MKFKKNDFSLTKWSSKKLTKMKSFRKELRKQHPMIKKENDWNYTLNKLQLILESKYFIPLNEEGN